MNDGIKLTSARHPVAPWWRRVLFWLKGTRLSAEAIEAVELDLSRVSTGGFKVGKRDET